MSALTAFGALTFARLDELLRTHRRLVVCTVVRTQGSVPRRASARMAVLPGGVVEGTIGGGRFESIAIEEAQAVLDDSVSRLRRYDFRPEGASPDAIGAICGGQVEVFFEFVGAAHHLLIVGGGHCGRALARAAALLDDWRITLVEERPEHAHRGDLPLAVALVAAASNYENLAPLVDADTDVVLVSQGADSDERALRRVADSDARYIGMMGSRKKARTVLDNLRRDGFAEASLARVHAPVGLEIGSETPAEIAVSILAQIIATRRNVKAEPEL